MVFAVDLAFCTNGILIIENQPLLREMFKDLPIISYKRGKSLQDILVRAKL